MYLTDAGIKAMGALNDLLENRPVTLGVDGARIRQWVSEDKKIESGRSAGLREAHHARFFRHRQDQQRRNVIAGALQCVQLRPRRRGDLQVDSSWRKGIRDPSMYVVYDDDGEEQKIHLMQKVK